MRLAALALAVSLSGCAMLDEMVTVTDPATGETAEVRVGDLAADALDSVSASAGEAVGATTTALTGNPVLGTGAAALLATLVGGATSRLRRRRQPGPTPAPPGPADPPSPPESL